MKKSRMANPFFKKDEYGLDANRIDYRTLEVYPASALSPRSPTYATTNQDFDAGEYAGEFGQQTAGDGFQSFLSARTGTGTMYNDVMA